MTTTHIVPFHKDDQAVLSALATADEAQIMLAANELLEWLQDGNWPVSLPIGITLAKHIHKIDKKNYKYFARVRFCLEILVGA